MTTNNQTSIASLAKKRRTYSAEFKQQIVQACKAPDVSIASVALQHGLNTNLVSKWIRLIDGKPGNDRSPLPNKPAFIALSCSAPLDPTPTDMLKVQITLPHSKAEIGLKWQVNVDIKSGATLTSCVVPSVIMKSIGLPCASTIKCIFEEFPPTLLEID